MTKRVLKPVDARLAGQGPAKPLAKSRAESARAGQASLSHSKRRPAAKAGRTNDPERTMASFLEVATAEFGEKGLAGARIDEIAAATKTSKRMIYDYFGNKEGLYLPVLEESYRRMRQINGQFARH